MASPVDRRPSSVWTTVNSSRGMRRTSRELSASVGGLTTPVRTFRARQEQPARGFPGRRSVGRRETADQSPHRGDQVGLELLGSLPILRGRMFGAERDQSLGLLGLLLPFPGGLRVLDAQKPVAHGRVDRVPARLVVVVREVEDLGTDVGRSSRPGSKRHGWPGRRVPWSWRSSRRWRRRGSTAGGRTARRTRRCRCRAAGPRRSRRRSRPGRCRRP